MTDELVGYMLIALVSFVGGYIVGWVLRNLLS